MVNLNAGFQVAVNLVAIEVVALRGIVHASWFGDAADNRVEFGFQVVCQHCGMDQA